MKNNLKFLAVVFALVIGLTFSSASYAGCPAIIKTVVVKVAKQRDCAGFKDKKAFVCRINNKLATDVTAKRNKAKHDVVSARLQIDTTNCTAAAEIKALKEAAKKTISDYVPPPSGSTSGATNNGNNGSM